MNKIIAFVLGAAAGSLLTWKLVEKKYRDLAEEEIESVREYYKGKKDDIEPIKGEVFDSDIKEVYLKKEEIKDRSDYDDILNGLGYTNEEMNELLKDPDVTVEEGQNGLEVYLEPHEKIEPYIISPEEFGEYDNYDTKFFTYYSDFVLTDNDDEIVSDEETLLGDGLNHFGEFEQNTVFVRNENTKCDYEVIKVEQSFTEINGGDM